jgi:transcriptional regulator
MYTPDLLKIEDSADITAIIRQNSFAVLTGPDADGSITGTHLPFMYDPSVGEYGRLIAHMSKRNSHWQGFASGADYMVIFAGPHGYISPTWYADEPAVPTWNYVAVHAYGAPRIIEDDSAKRQMLMDLVTLNEAQFDDPWTYQGSEDFMVKMIRATVAFEIDITRLDAKAKLGQNRTDGDKTGTEKGLRALGDDMSLALASLSKKFND